MKTRLSRVRERVRSEKLNENGDARREGALRRLCTEILYSRYALDFLSGAATLRSIPTRDDMKLRDSISANKIL